MALYRWKIQYDDFIWIKSYLESENEMISTN